MVFFNAPKEVKNHGLQAVCMAIEMRDCVRELIKRWAMRDLELGFGMGIDQGHVSTGTIGFEGRYDYAAIGSAVNRASRLCGAAKDDQILVSQRVYAEVHEAIELEPLEERIELKGLGLTRAYNAIRRKDQASPLPSSHEPAAPYIDAC
jgi:class 3 adenylate cyclase